jgi:hypothetical protein
VLALLGLGRTATDAGREVADGDRHDEVDRQRHPVRGVGQRERVERRQEEEVECEHAEDRGGDPVREAPGDGDRDDRQQVDGAKADNRGNRVEQVDEPCDDADRRDGRRRAIDVSNRCPPHAKNLARAWVAAVRC